jgi:uncharacterized protein YegL
MAEVSRPMRPGGEIARRDMHFFWLLDGSTSMAAENGLKIAALNYAVAQAIPGMRDVAKKNPQALLLVRALRFASDIEWLIEQPTPIAELTWEHEIKADGETAMAKAISTVVDKLDKLDTSRRYFPPAIILVTDGHPTDGEGAFDDALRRLTTHKVGRISQRFAVAIGADADKDILKKFIGDDGIPVLEANDSDSLERMIKIVSRTAVESSSQVLSSSAAAEQLKAEQRVSDRTSTEGIHKWN